MGVAIYHPFTDLADNYSLSHVVTEQMLMLTEHDIPTTFVTSKSFKGDVPDGVKVAAILPSDVGKAHCGIGSLLKNNSHVLTHDILYLPSYKNHESVLRKIAKEQPYIKWIHWSHSAPAGKLKPFPNSIYVAMNYTDLPRVAEQFGVPEAHVRVVYNPVSPDTFFGWHPFTKHLVDKHKLLECDVLIICPLDTGRFDAKGGRKVIAIVKEMRAKGKDAKVVFVNAAANEKKRRKLVESLASESVIFTSNEDKKYEVCVPRVVVRELMQISNLFLLLSISEGCSLTMLEAALTKNLVVLNEDFPPMREFGEIDHVAYMKVGSTRAQTQYNPSEAHYMKEWAQRLLNEVEGNKALRFNRKVLKKFNRKWIWKNQLSPILT